MAILTIDQDGLVTMATLVPCYTTLAACEKPYIREKITRTQRSILDHASNNSRTNARCSQSSRFLGRGKWSWLTERVEAVGVVTQRGLNNVRVVQLKATNVE
jgi:hypothetical protein